MRCQKKEYAPPRIKGYDGISTDSVLNKDNGRYGPRNLNDKTELSWCEGAKDDGIGSKITILLDYQSRIESLFIKNGYGDPKYYARNNRVKDIRVHTEKGKTQGILKDSPELQGDLVPQWQSNNGGLYGSSEFFRLL